MIPAGDFEGDRMRPSRTVILANALLALAASSHAEPATPTRTEVAVREVLLSDGTRRYAVPIKVGASLQAIAITPDGKTAYVASFAPATVTPVTIATGAPGKPIMFQAAMSLLPP